MSATAAFAAPARPSTPSLFATVALWAERVSQRRALASLSIAELKDIGVDPADAQAEAAKPFWVA
ncbi:DUF1127 domain-containing protein [Phenylobacterium sp.]|uniref:DUF1127 domain-containing protein n=1 Tax=Phenylobacterium sp. TaxID=1871053 RepID=UPI002BB5FBDB|nr:DUF1127 domain-containing protein [Phenylobacterium sp.]HLZ74784.1 DUF1127 domain-containing protein [Phenylobacterium sp.]